VTTTRVGKVDFRKFRAKTTTEMPRTPRKDQLPFPPPQRQTKVTDVAPCLPISGGMQIGLDWLTWVRMDPIGVDGFRGGLAVALGRQRAEPVHSDGGGYAGHSRGTDARGSTGACATQKERRIV